MISVAWLLLVIENETGTNKIRAWCVIFIYALTASTGVVLMLHRWLIRLYEFARENLYRRSR
jgi:hypothetical protein